LGLISEGITEIIAVTEKNAAPIGIIQRENMCPKLILYKGSNTEKNIRKCGWMTANFVSDSYWYPYYAFRDVSAEELANDGEYQYLKTADAYIIFKATVTNETDKTYLIDLTPVKEITLHQGIRRVNRGFDAVIDASVHATRYIVSPTKELEEKMLYDFDLVKKCGGVREKQAVELIREVCHL